jgi:hypothetical protein
MGCSAPVSGQERIGIVKKNSVLFLGGVPPISVFLLVAAGLLSIKTAFRVAALLLLIALAFHGFVARRLSGGTVWLCLLSGLFDLLIGLALVAFRVFLM